MQVYLKWILKNGRCSENTLLLQPLPLSPEYKIIYIPWTLLQDGLFSTQIVIINFLKTTIVIMI
jgi:hypothetical protein